MTKPTTRRRLGALATVLAAVAAVVGVGRAVDLAGATAEFQFDRFAGQDRFDTAALIAERTWGTAPTVLLARANIGQPLAFADALAGNYLAGHRQAPILLTNTESLPERTRQAMTTLGTNRVVILGGVEAVSSAVETELRARPNTTVERIGGVDRFATAADVARSPGAAGVGTVGGRRTAIVTTGVNFPDPLAAGPASYAGRLPILLSLPTTLPPSSRQALTDLAIDHVVIVGGPEAVSPNIEAEIQQARPGATTQRIGGLDRHETATLLADFEVQTLGFSTSHVNVARSDQFPDALAGGPHGGRERSAILLTPNTSAHPVTCSWLSRNASTLTSGHIFGGLFAVSQAAEDELERCAGATSTTTTTLPTTTTVPTTTSTTTPPVTSLGEPILETVNQVTTATVRVPVTLVPSLFVQGVTATPTAGVRNVVLQAIVTRPIGVDPPQVVLSPGPDNPTCTGADINQTVDVTLVGLGPSEGTLQVILTYEEFTAGGTSVQRQVEVGPTPLPLPVGGGSTTRRIGPVCVDF